MATWHDPDTWMEEDISFGQSGAESPYATLLDTPMYIGTTQTGKKGGKWKAGGASTKEYDQMISNALKYSFDYSKAGWDPSLLAMLGSTFSGRPDTSGGQEYFEQTYDPTGESSRAYGGLGTEDLDIYKYVDIFDPTGESQAAGLNLAGGLAGQEGRIRARDIVPLTFKDFAQTQDPFYSGTKQIQGESLLEKLISGIKTATGGIGRRSGGGMAGSGGMLSDIQSQRGGWKRGWTGLLSEIETRKAQALANLQDKIQAYSQLIQ